MVFVINVRNMKYLCLLILNFLHQTHRSIGQGQKSQGQKGQGLVHGQGQDVQLQKYLL